MLLQHVSTLKAIQAMLLHKSIKNRKFKQGMNNMIYFTSDLHLNHRAVIPMCERPFDSVEEMNRVLIDNINAKVKKNDTLYILGDLTNKGTVASANELISQIQCKNLILIKGNHDKKYDDHLFKEVHKLTEIHVGSNETNHSITLCHFPMLSWPKSGHGSIHLHGHIHSRGNAYNIQMCSEKIYRYDVGIDANDYQPVSLQELISFMEV